MTQMGYGLKRSPDNGDFFIYLNVSSSGVENVL